MQAASTPLPLRELRQDLARPELRRRIAAIVRGRVPRADEEDVIQSALCDALAAERVPEDPEQRARWIGGIARHKVADYHRAAWREQPSEESSVTAPPAPFEARGVLADVAKKLDGDERAMQTLQWLVREHEGERFAEIAREASLSPALVRKRVSRLRRVLRAKWIGAIAAAFAVAGLAWGWRAWSERRDGATGVIGADPSAASATPAPSSVPPVLRGVQGSWVVDRVDPDASVDSRTRAFVSAQAAAARLEVRGDQLSVDAPAFRFASTIRVGASDAAGNVSFQLVEPSGRAVSARGRILQDGRIVVAGRYAGFSGSITFRRP